MRLLRNLDLDGDGLTVCRYPDIASDIFRRLQETTYAQLRPGQNATNQLARGIAWGIYVGDRFIWTDRTSYSLPAELNPEEAGRVRSFVRIDEAFLTAPEVEAFFRDAFLQFRFREPSSDRAYELMVGAFRYEPTAAMPALPSPIAPHQDLVDSAILVAGRTGPIAGGTSRIYDLSDNPLYEFDLRVGEALFVRDHMIKHQVTPLLLVPDRDWRPGDPAWRDVLIARFQPVGR